MRNYGIPLFFSKMALHGGGHLELKIMHKGDFWGLFGICLGRCPCIILEKISSLQFYSRLNPNALALYGLISYNSHVIFNGMTSQLNKTFNNAGLMLTYRYDVGPTLNSIVSASCICLDECDCVYKELVVR